MSARDAASAEVTELLFAWNDGDRGAFDQLIPLVVDDLRRLARRQLAKERVNHTLQPTALINEVYLRWSHRHDFDWRSRAHFFGLAAAQIRHLLIEHARKKKAAKRGGEKTPIRLVDPDELRGEPGAEVDLIDLDRALVRLQEMDSQLCRLVELRFFAGLSATEAAEVLGVTERTVHRHWAWIRAWLLRRLTSEAAT